MNIYDEAIHVQDACNPNGVARFLVKCLQHMRDEENVTDTAAQCRHPLFVVVVNKLDSLVQGNAPVMGSDVAFADAYTACRARSKDHDHMRRDVETSEGLPGH